jgi:hypothetical protein
MQAGVHLAHRIGRACHEGICDDSFSSRRAPRSVVLGLPALGRWTVHAPARAQPFTLVNMKTRARETGTVSGIHTSRGCRFVCAQIRAGQRLSPTLAQPTPPCSIEQSYPRTRAGIHTQHERCVMGAPHLVFMSLNMSCSHCGS